MQIGQPIREFNVVFCSMTNCEIRRRTVMEHWPKANEKRCNTRKERRVWVHFEMNSFCYDAGFTDVLKLSNLTCDIIMKNNN